MTDNDVTGYAAIAFPVYLAILNHLIDGEEFPISGDKTTKEVR